MHIFRKAISAITNSPAQLLLNGYRLDSSGHIIGQRPGPRALFDQIGAISIETRDTELVEKLVEVIDEVRALVGRDSSRSVILFRVEGAQSVIPDVRGVTYRTGVFELVRKGEPVTISCLSAGAIVPVYAYAWGERSPYSVARDALPILDAKLGEDVIDAAFKLNCTWRPSPEEIEREKRLEKFRQDVAAGRVRLKTEAEIAAEDEARRDAETVEAWKDQDVSWADGNHATLVLGARARHARRQKQTETTDAA